MASKIQKSHTFSYSDADGQAILTAGPFLYFFKIPYSFTGTIRPKNTEFCNPKTKTFIMKRFIQSFILALAVLFISGSRAQSFGLPWQQVTQVPGTDIYSLNHIANELYASEGNFVHYSSNAATSWSMSAALTPSPVGSSDIISYNGRLYSASYGQGVFVSQTNGSTWSQLNNGLGSNVPIKFTTLNGKLYVATDDNGVYQLNATGTQWSAFNAGLATGGWGSGFNCLATCGNAIIGGVGANGFVVYFQDTATVWKGAAITGSILPGLTVYDLLYTGNYLWAVTNNKVFASSDKGITWTPVANGMSNGFYGKIVNVSGTLYVAVNTVTGFRIYKRSILDPLPGNWTIVDTFTGYTCYGMSQVNSRFYVATSLGLYYLDVSMPTGVDKAAAGAALFAVTPNPGSEQLKVYTENLAAEECSLYNPQGEKVLSVKITGALQSMDVSGLAEGVYYTRLTGKEINLTKKIIIKR